MAPFGFGLKVEERYDSVHLTKNSIRRRRPPFIQEARSSLLMA